MNTFSISPMSEQAGQRRPGRKLLCSTAAGWQSLLVQTYEQPGFVEQYETLPSPDLLLVVVQQGDYTLESFSSGTWRKALYRPGVAGTTAPMISDRLRWHSKTSKVSRLIRAYIPPPFFAEAAEEFRKPGSSRRTHFQDLLAFNDPVVVTTMHSLAAAVKAGLPNLYAESAGRFLAAHLLSRSLGWTDADACRRIDSEFDDARLRRTLEYMVLLQLKRFAF